MCVLFHLLRITLWNASLDSNILYRKKIVSQRNTENDDQTSKTWYNRRKNSGLTVRNKPQMLSFNIKISSYLRLTMLHSFNRYMKPAMFIHDKSVASVKRVISDQYIRRCRLRSYQVWRRCGSGLWRAARGWDGCRQPSPPRSRSSAAALWSPQSQPELTLQEKSEAFNAY